MFRKLFGREKKNEAGLYEPCMPEVDEPPEIEEIFNKVRRVAAGEEIIPGSTANRHVVVVTPGRIFMMKECPPPGSMPNNQVASIEKMISPKVKRNIAVIAYTELKAITTDITKAIPFFGILIGFAYIGHSVWVFEG